MHGQTMTDTPAPHEHIVATEFDGGEGVLVDLNSQRYYSAQTAMRVLLCLERECRPEMSANDRAYDVAAEHAAAPLPTLHSSNPISSARAPDAPRPRPQPLGSRAGRAAIKAFSC